MDTEMIMPEEVHNTNILHSEEEVFNQRRFEWFEQSDVLPQDYMKIKTHALEDPQLIKSELRRLLFERFGQLGVLPQDYMKINIDALEDRRLIEPERRRLFDRFGQLGVLPQNYMKINIDALEDRHLIEPERRLERFGQSDVFFEPELRRLFERFGQSDVLFEPELLRRTDVLFQPELRRRLFERFGRSDVLFEQELRRRLFERFGQSDGQSDVLFEPELLRRLFERFGQSDVQDRRIIREAVLGLMEFLTFILHSVFLIPGNYYRALYILMFCVVRYQAQALITQSASKLGTQSLLSMGEAFTEFFPQMTQMMTIMLCYLLMLWLVCPLDPVIQISIILLLIVAPCYYIPQALGMASGIDVACGFFKVPLIWFTASGALALALIFVFITLLLIYLIRRFIHPGNLKENKSNFIHPGDPSVEKLIEASLDALSGENMA